MWKPWLRCSDPKGGGALQEMRAPERPQGRDVFLSPLYFPKDQTTLIVTAIYEWAVCHYLSHLEIMWSHVWPMPRSLWTLTMSKPRPDPGMTFYKPRITPGIG